MTKKNLTDTVCLAAKAAPGQRLELWDTKIDGLALRVTDKGVKSWIVRYKAPDGRRARFTLPHRFPALGLADARIVAADLIARIARGEDPQAEKADERRRRGEEPIKTFADLAEAYFAACESGRYKAKVKRKKPKTIADERAIIRRYVPATFSRRAPETITRRDVRNLLLDTLEMKRTDRAGQKAGAMVTTQANRLHATLRQIFAYGIREERLDGMNPAKDISAPAEEKPRSNVWTDPQLKKVWTTLTDAAQRKAAGVSRPVAIALQLTALTLQRENEVAGMMRAELDLDLATWTIPAERTKNRRPHLVPLSAPALALVKEALALGEAGRPYQPEAVFPTPHRKARAARPGQAVVAHPERNGSKPIRGHSVGHAMGDLRRHCGIEGVTVHDLRRTGATMMASERIGILPYVVSKVLNHTDAGGAAAVTGLHYITYAYAAEKRRALDAWADLLLEIVGERARPTNVVPMKEVVGG